MENIDKIKYIDKAEFGTIVAFVDGKGKTRSAAIKERDSENRTLIVETEFNKEFFIKYEDVLWVKNGPRFPRGVYNMLKGIDKNTEVENNEGK